MRGRYIRTFTTPDRAAPGRLGTDTAAWTRIVKSPFLRAMNREEVALPSCLCTTDWKFANSADIGTPGSYGDTTKRYLSRSRTGNEYRSQRDGERGGRAITRPQSQIKTSYPRSRLVDLPPNNSPQRTNSEYISFKSLGIYLMENPEANGTLTPAYAKRLYHSDP